MILQGAKGLIFIFCRVAVGRMIREFNGGLFVVVVVFVRISLVRIRSDPVHVPHCACAFGVIVFSSIIASYGVDDDPSDDTKAQNPPKNRRHRRSATAFYRNCLFFRLFFGLFFLSVPVSWLTVFSGIPATTSV